MLFASIGVKVWIFEREREGGACLLRDELMLWTFSLFFGWPDVEASRSFREVLGVREHWRGFVLRSCSVVFPVMASLGLRFVARR